MEEKALTLNQLIKYNNEVLLPAFDDRIDRLLDSKIEKLEKKFVSKNEFNEFKSESLTNQDEMLKKLDMLIQENKIRNYQEKKQKEFFAIIIKALKDKGILTEDQLERIVKLEIF